MYKLFTAVVVVAIFGAVACDDHDHESLAAAHECDLGAHHLHCHDPNDDSIHLCIGDSVSLAGKCEQMTCIHFDGNVVLTRGCHTITPKSECHLSAQDNTKDYPECCPQEVC